MFRIRNPRAGFFGAAATVALAALSLTACSDQGSGSKDEGAPPAAAADQSPSPGASSAPTSAPAANNAPTSVPSAPPAVPSARPAAPAGSQPKANTAATKAPAPSSSEPVTCEASNTKMTAGLVNRPVNHMLLTVTNTGSRACFLYGYPALDFSGAQAVPPVMEDSVPQAVTTLNPGQSGYASVTLTAGDGSGTNGRTVKSLEVSFSGRSGIGSVGAAARVGLPAQGVSIDDSLTTTYWEQSMDEALAW